MFTWISQNKKLVVVGVAIIALGIALATGAITFEQFVEFFKQSQSGLDDAPAAIDSLADSLGG